MKTIWKTLLDSYCRKTGSDEDYSAKKIESVRKLAEGYMTKHPNEDLFPVRFNRQCDNMRLSYLIRLSPEEIVRLKGYGLEECEDICTRILDDVTFPINDESSPWDVEEIDLEPVRNYAFTMAVFKNGSEEAPVRRTLRVPLSNEEFAALLSWRLLHRDDAFSSFNVLRESLPMVFDKISTSLEWFFFDNLARLANAPYAVFMDEVEEAVKEILAEV